MHWNKSIKFSCIPLYLLTGTPHTRGTLSKIQNIPTKYKWLLLTLFVDNLFRFVYSIADTIAFHGEFFIQLFFPPFHPTHPLNKQLFCLLSCFGSVAKSLGYKIQRNNQMPTKTSLLEFNYDVKFSIQNRKQEQDMWNICWWEVLGWKVLDVLINAFGFE